MFMLHKTRKSQCVLAKIILSLFLVLSTNPVAFADYTYASGANHAAFPFKSKSTGTFYVVLCDEIFPNGVDLTEPSITA